MDMKEKLCFFSKCYQKEGISICCEKGLPTLTRKKLEYTLERCHDKKDITKLFESVLAAGTNRNVQND